MGADEVTAENLLTELKQGLHTRLAARYSGASLDCWENVGHSRATQLDLLAFW